MTWAKIDDQFPDHPKVVAAGGDAAWLYVAALCYCQAKLTDGHIPAGIVPRLTDRKAPMRLAAILVEVGLWHALDDGFKVHDYHDMNPLAAEVRAKRAATTARVARWRSERGRNAVGNAVTGSVANAVGNAPPTPTPTPTVLSPPTPPRRGARNRVDPAASEILADLNASRQRVIPGARPLRPTPENLRHIADRLTAGATLDDCRHVLAVREAEVRAKPDSAQWFDAVTPFRPDQFAKALAASPGANGAPAPLAHVPLPRLTRPA